MGWYDPPDIAEPVDNYCPRCEQETPHIPTTTAVDSMGCINGTCNECGNDNLIEVIDPDHQRDVKEDR